MAGRLPEKQAEAFTIGQRDRHEILGPGTVVDVDTGKGAHIVRFDGIAHVILETPLPRERAEALAPLWCRHLGAESLGILTFDRPAGTLLPLVYVPAADTLCWEHSCASGTTAVGAFLAAGEGPGSWSFRQPGGILTVEADPAGRLFLTGYVRLCARRSIRIAE